MLSIPHCLDNRLTAGGEFVNLTRLLPFTPREIPGTHSCWRESQSQGHSAAGRIGSAEESNDLIAACGIMSQVTTLPRAPKEKYFISVSESVLVPQVGVLASLGSGTRTEYSMFLAEPMRRVRVAERRQKDMLLCKSHTVVLTAHMTVRYRWTSAPLLLPRSDIRSSACSVCPLTALLREKWQ
jgi:hypothetical protein